MMQPGNDWRLRRFAQRDCIEYALWCAPREAGDLAFDYKGTRSEPWADLIVSLRLFEGGVRLRPQPLNVI